MSYFVVHAGHLDVFPTWSKKLGPKTRWRT